MTADWGYMENASMGFDSSSDLFGGVLFGDELMDLYNPDGNGRPTGAPDTNQTMPNFVPKSEDKSKNNQSVKSESKEENGGDLGAFRPSSSCSELDTLMPKNEASNKANSVAVKVEPTDESPSVPLSAAVTDPTTMNNTKKRSDPPSDASSAESPCQKMKIETQSSSAIVALSPPIAPQSAPAPPPQQQPTAPILPVVVAPAAPLPATIAPLPRVGVPAAAANDSDTTVPSKINKPKGPVNVTAKAPLSPYVPPMIAHQNSNPNNAVLLAKPLNSNNLGIPHNNNALPRMNSIPQPNILAPPPPAANAPPAPVRLSMVAPPQVALTNMMVPHVPPPPSNLHPVVPLKQSPPQAKQPRSKAPEEQFKGVAQAAVSNLILSASSNNSQTKSTKSPVAVSEQMKKTVDTSSAHIAALTSSNWVAACTASMSGDESELGSLEAEQAAALAAASDPAAAKAARARRANLTPDERARQNRDRNREHARNTRLRKKAYVEELKKTLTELVAQRDASELEKRHETQRDLEVREVRFRVMEEFLKLRACGGDPGLLARWVAILDDGFTLSLPKTPYRHMVPTGNKLFRSVSSENANVMAPSAHAMHQNQGLKGATESMADAAKVSSFINSLGNNRGNTTGPAVTSAYHCDRKHFMMDNTTACLDWTLTTNGLIGQGLSAELYFRGSMRAKFCPASNKLASAELHFDTGSVINQTKRSTTTFLSPASITQYVPTPSPLSLQPTATAPSAPQVVKEVLTYEQQAQPQQPLQPHQPHQPQPHQPQPHQSHQPQHPQHPQHQPLTTYNYSSTISVSSTDGNESSTDGNV